VKSFHGELGEIACKIYTIGSRGNESCSDLAIILIYEYGFS
jgi:hypothetical protein